MKTMQYLTDVVTLKLNSNLCSGCGLCVDVCPHDVFEIFNGKARIKDINDCMECGACAKNCRFKALSVRSGVGCAAGIINGILNKSNTDCGCSQPAGEICC